MDGEERQHLETMRQAHIKRLHKLQEQAATLGDSTPAHILIEIDDLTAAIRELNGQLGLKTPEPPKTGWSEVHDDEIAPSRLRPIRLSATSPARPRPRVSVIIGSAVVVIFALGFAIGLYRQIQTTGASGSTALPTANISVPTALPSSSTESTQPTTPPEPTHASAASAGAEAQKAVELPTNTSAEPELITAKTFWESCPIARVLPGYIHPEQNAQEAITQIEQARTDGTMLEWEQVVHAGSLHTLTTLTSISEDSVDLDLSNSAQIEIHASAAPDHVDIYEVGQCGAGGNIRIFPPIQLDAAYKTYTGSTTNTEFEYFTLATGKIEKFAFDYECKSPGTYAVKLTIPYHLRNNAYNVVIQSPTYLLCPKSYTAWTFFDKNATEFFSVHKFAWNGEKYEEVPR